MNDDRLIRWKQEMSIKLEGLPHYQMKVFCHNHRGTGGVLMFTGHIAEEQVTGLWIAASMETIDVFNPHATNDDPYPYTISVEYSADLPMSHIPGSGQIHFLPEDDIALPDFPTFPLDDMDRGDQ